MSAPIFFDELLDILPKCDKCGKRSMEMGFYRTTWSLDQFSNPQQCFTCSGPEDTYDMNEISDNIAAWRTEMFRRTKNSE